MIFYNTLEFYLPSLDDAANHARWISLILSLDHIPNYDNLVFPEFSGYIYYPLGFHIVAAFLSEILGVSVITILKFFPYFISAMIVIVVYVYVRNVFNTFSGFFSGFLAGFYCIVEFWYLTDGAFARVTALFIVILFLYFLNKRKPIAAMFMFAAVANLHFYVFILGAVFVIFALFNFRQIYEGIVKFVKNLRFYHILILSLIGFYFYSGLYRNLKTLTTITAPTVSLASLEASPFLTLIEFTVSYFILLSPLVILSGISIIYLAREHNKQAYPLVTWCVFLLSAAFIFPFIGQFFVSYRLIRELTVPLMIISGIAISYLIVDLNDISEKNEAKMLLIFLMYIVTFSFIRVNVYTAVGLIFLTTSLLVLNKLKIDIENKRKIYAYLCFGIMSFYGVFFSFNWFIPPTNSRLHASDYYGMIWVKESFDYNIAIYGAYHPITPWIPVYTGYTTYYFSNFTEVFSKVYDTPAIFFLGSNVTGYLPPSAQRFFPREEFENTSLLVKIYDCGQCDIYATLPTFL
ncbi:MAG: hypothetical protein ACTSPL_08250 [Candidatus Odinarchaeia archaeon]